MACCCLSARCRPPDSDGCLKDRHAKLPLGNETNKIKVCDIKKEASICCFKTSKLSNEADIKEQECPRLVPLKSVMSLTERDKDIIKLQLSIWFPRILSRPFLRGVREVKSHISQTLSSLTFLKRNAALSESKRQRVYHRNYCRKQQYNSMILELSKSLPETKELTLKETEEFSGECCFAIEKPSHYDSSPTLSHGETNSNSVSRNRERKSHLSEDASGVEGDLNLVKVPNWFISFVESTPNLDLDLLTNYTCESQLTAASHRRLELIPISHQNDSRRNGTYYVSIKEMVSDCLDAATLAERRSSFQRADYHMLNAIMRDKKKRIQTKRSVSDQSLNSNSEKRKEKKRWRDSSFSEQKRVAFKRNWPQYTKQSRKTKRESLDNKTCRFYQINCLQPEGKAQTCSYLTENVPNGDFVENERSNENSRYGETQSIFSLMHEKHNHFEGQGKVIRTASIPNITIATTPKSNHLSHIDISCTRLNISNSSSNGINRTHLYSRDYFFGNPKTKASYTKHSGKDEERAVKEKPTKSLRRKGSASLSGSPDFRQAIFASSQHRHSVKNASESSEDDSRSGNTMEELSNYKAIKRVAGKLNPQLSLADSSYAKKRNALEIKRNIQEREDLRQLRDKLQTTQRKSVHKTQSAEVREEDGLIAMKYISESYSQNTVPSMKELSTPKYRKSAISTTLGGVKDLVELRAETETSAATPNAIDTDDTQGGDQDLRKSNLIKHKGVFHDTSQLNINPSDGKQNIDLEKSRQSRLKKGLSPTYESSNFQINLAHGISKKSLKKTYDTSVTSNADRLVDNQIDAVRSNEAVKITQKNVKRSIETSSNLFVDKDESYDGNQKIYNEQEETHPINKTSTFQGNIASSIPKTYLPKIDHDTSEPDTKRMSNASHLVGNQGDAVDEKENDKAVEKTANQSSEPSSDVIKDIVGDSYSGNHKIPTLQDENFKLSATAQGDSRINIVDSDKLLKEGGDGPDLSKQTVKVPSTDLQSLTFTPGDVTSNAGGEEEEETALVSPKTSGPTIDKSEVPGPGNNVADVEKRASTSEAGAKTENEEKEKGEQVKEDPCLDTLSECMRKWGRPNCGRNYSYMPNLDPPCCKLCNTYPNYVEAKPVEEEKEASKEESKAMKCNYTGFTEDRQSELEALIDKHVSYLRCTQGENATMPKQTSFISSAPDPYSQLCKDLAFKSCAGVCNQSVNKDMYPCGDICGQLPEICRDPCPKLPPLCIPPPCCPDSFPPTCYRDPCPKLPKLCTTPPLCPDSCFPAPCCTKLPSIGKIPSRYLDPCSTLPKSNLCCPDPYLKQSSASKCCIDPCTYRSPRYCIDPCTSSSCNDPCLSTQQPCIPRSCYVDPCGSPPPCRIDPCTGLPKSCSPPRSCIDPCTGLPKRLSPRLSCIDPCTGLPKSCMDPCSVNPIPCKPYTNFPKQYRIDPITRLPILCSPSNRLNACFDLCDKISSVSCNSASDTKLSMFNSSFSFYNEPYRPCPPPCGRQCSGSLSFLSGKPISVSRRRSSSLDHFKGLHQRRLESQNLARKLQCVESKWSGIKQKACEVMDQIAKLQQEACCPKPEPCQSPCANPCPSPICDPCPSPILNPCSSPICKPCPSPVYACAPRTSPICNPCISPRCWSLKPCYERPQGGSCLYKPTPMCLDSFSLRNIYPSEMQRTYCPTSCMKTATVCCMCDKQTTMACRSACNQTSEFGRFPSSKCSTSCAQLNESSNKKSQTGSKNKYAEISTDIGPSLMGPTLPRKRGRTEKRCTIMRVGKCEEGGQAREPNTNTDLSCCSTQVEGGKIAEIAKFVKECFDDSTVSAITGRPVVKIRYNRGGNNYSPCQDIRLKEQIAKAIKKGKEIQKKNCEKNGKNGDVTRSRTVLRFKANKNSHGSCEIYNVQLEDDNSTNVKKDSSRKRKSEFAEDSNPEQKGKSCQQNLDIHKNKTSSQDSRFISCEPVETESSGSQEDFNECHRGMSPRDNKNACLENSNLYHRAFDPCDEQKLNKPSKAEKNQSQSVVPPNSNAGMQLKDKSHVDCTDEPCVVLKRQRHFQFAKGIPSKENSDEYELECKGSCPQKRAASYNRTSSHPCFKQTHESDIERQHNGCQSQIYDNQLNTNENANSEQFSKDGDKIICKQIPGILSGENDDSYDLSQYDYCMKSEAVGSNKFVCDVFIESNESAMCKVNTACGKQPKSSLDRDALFSPFNTNMFDFQSPKSRYIRKQCFYIDDPSWEAFEYIGAHVFSLPTSYSSGRKKQHQNCDNASNKKSETKRVKKRNMCGRSRYTNCEKSKEGIYPFMSPDQSQIEQGKVSRTLVVKDKKYDCNKTKNVFKAKGADESTVGITYGTHASCVKKKETKVKTPCDSSETVLHRATVGSQSQDISELYKKYQSGDQASKRCSTKPTKWVPRETICKSSPSSLPIANNSTENYHDPSMTSHVKYNCNREKVKTSAGIDIKNGSGSVTEFCFSIEGSEDSCHGIEDLPLDTDSPYAQINKITAPKKRTCYVTNKSSASSENKTIYAGDYVEVCSSVPFQNKTLTPKCTNMACDRQTQIPNHNEKKCVKSFEQIQKKSENLKFRIVPLNEHVLSEKSSQEKNFQREVLEIGSCLINSQHKRDRSNPINGSVKMCFQDLTNIHDKKNPTADGANLNSATSDSFRLSSKCEHSRKYSISNGLLQKSDQKVYPLIDLFQMTQHSVTETPNKPNLTINTPYHVSCTESIDKARLLGHVDSIEQGVCDLKTNASLSQSNSFNRFENGEMKEPSDRPVKNKTVDAKIMTGRSVTSLHQRDMALQVMHENLNYPKSYIAEQNMVDKCSSLSTVYVPQKSQLNQEAIGGGDAWTTVQVGCAEVTQASQNRVILQGAYIQQQSQNMATSKPESLRARNETIIPFRLVFLKTSGTGKKKLNLKGTYSRPHLDSSASSIEIWGFQV
ncbi:hypothetical protein RRG08_058307 [Elysia crispata]|uniref:Uncharacterized protein n=1 Tax=Elysia crispata TaxID=231223 RepID=A0AAE0YVB9_9GAST|nr:hypothetical protein RRG08_058307 [Elysia crispata]